VEIRDKKYMNTDLKNDSELLDQLENKEKSSKFSYDDSKEDKDVKNVEIPEWIPKEAPQTLSNPNPLGRVSKSPLAMESEWKNIPVDTLPSRGFGYPPGFEIVIKPALVTEIRHYSTIDESDRIDLDDKLNNIISKCMKIRWDGGFLDPLDLWYEDRFYTVMSIRDLTFIKGENRVLLPVTKNCTKPECEIPDQIELKANLLDSFQMELDLIKRYNKETYSFKLIPKDGSPEMNLYIPTVGVTTEVRKIIESKKAKGKKYDESFAKVAAFIIPDWRELDERAYDQYERASIEWTPLQFSIADQISEKINFATKSRIYSKCTSCDGEVTAEIRFPGGYRSLFIISDIFGQLL
jgi:hypothetical protein